MKRYIVFALIALVALFAFDMLANTGITEAVKEKVTTAGGMGTALMVAGAGAVIVKKGDETEVQSETKEKSARERLWVIPASEFDELEAKYRKLYVIDVTIDKDERYQFIARRPSKNLIDALTASREDISEVMELMLKNMLVMHSASNPEDLEDGVVYQHVLKALTGISKVGKQLFTKA